MSIRRGCKHIQILAAALSNIYKRYILYLSLLTFTSSPTPYRLQYQYRLSTGMTQKYSPIFIKNTLHDFLNPLTPKISLVILFTV